MNQSESKIRKNTKHGMTHSVEYRVWRDMKQRCFNPKVKAFKYYGGRGIGVCESWLKFINFYADMGPRPPSKQTIERIDNSKGYGPENCIWVTQREQMRNTCRVKLSAEIAAKIRAQRFVPAIFLAQIYGVAKDTIRGIWHGRAWPRSFDE